MSSMTTRLDCPNDRRFFCADCHRQIGAGSRIVCRCNGESGDAAAFLRRPYFEAFIVVDGMQESGRERSVGRNRRSSEIVIEPVTAEQAKIARHAYRDYGRGSSHPANLNFGDCFSYALARDKREPILYKGDDFIHTDLRSAVGHAIIQHLSQPPPTVDAFRLITFLVRDHRAEGRSRSFARFVSLPPQATVIVLVRSKSITTSKVAQARCLLVHSG